MRPETWRLLTAHAGRAASLSGATQVRAGAVRPELLIPVDDPPAALASRDERLRVGAAVRVWSAAAFGCDGRVDDLPRAAEPVESEAILPVAVVRLASGRRVRVARKNLEVL